MTWRGEVWNELLLRVMQISNSKFPCEISPRDPKRPPVPMNSFHSTDEILGAGYRNFCAGFGTDRALRSQSPEHTLIVVRFDSREDRGISINCESNEHEAPNPIRVFTCDAIRGGDCRGCGHESVGALCRRQQIRCRSGTRGASWRGDQNVERPFQDHRRHPSALGDYVALRSY